MSNKLVIIMSEAITNFMRNKETNCLNGTRAIKAIALDIALRDKRKELQDSDIITAATKCKAEAAESILIYQNLEGDVAKKNFLAANTLDCMCDTYLPIKISEDEMVKGVDEAISETAATTMKDMGKVMAYFKDNHDQGTYDNKFVSTNVRSKLG